MDNPGAGSVADVRQGNPVAVGGHPVGAAGAGIGSGNRRQLAHIVDEVDLLERLAHRDAEGSARRGDVLKGSGGGEAGVLLQLLDQLPGVQGVQEVDIPRLAV